MNLAAPRPVLRNLSLVALFAFLGGTPSARAVDNVQADIAPSREISETHVDVVQDDIAPQKKTVGDNYFRPKPKKKKHTLKRHAAHVPKNSVQVPAGVPTTLPQKHTVTQTGPAPEIQGESAYGEAVVSTQERSSKFRPSVAVSVGIINNNNAEFGAVAGSSLNSQVMVSQVVPRLVYDLTADTSIYGTAPFSAFTTGVTTIGRPAFGIFKTIPLGDGFSWGLGLGVKLPTFSAYAAQAQALPLVEPLRVWEFAPGGTVGYTIPGTTLRMSETIDVAYDTQASFTSTLNDGSGVPFAASGFRYPLITRATFELSEKLNNLTVGLGFHTVSWLTSAQMLAQNGGENESVDPLELFRGELTGAYEFSGGTNLSLSFSRGLSIDANPLTFAFLENPLDVSSYALSLGVSRVF